MSESSEQEMIQQLKSEISSNSGSYIHIAAMQKSIEGMNSEMPSFLMSSDGRATFRQCIGKLISDNLISPVGSKSNLANGLYSKYRICKAPKYKDGKLANQIICEITPPACIDFYLRNPDLYLEDRDVIEKIMDFLTHATGDIVTVNERSYQIFGDEKFFRGAQSSRSRGETILHRLGLDYSDIDCEETVEPFFSFMSKGFHTATDRYIFIIENRDTFWSFKRSIMNSMKADMVIFGEGRKILSSFQFIEEYNVDPDRDTVAYFGDLDAEGVNIFCELTERYSAYNIKPFHDGYEALMEIGSRHEMVKIPKQQRINREHIEKFCSFFGQALAQQLGELLNGGFYIPQEALSATVMRERFGGTAANE